MRDVGTRWGCSPALWLFGVLAALILAALSVSEPVGPDATPVPASATAVVLSFPSPRPMRPTPTFDSWCRTVPASSCSYYENYGKP